KQDCSVPLAVKLTDRTCKDEPGEPARLFALLAFFVVPNPHRGTKNSYSYRRASTVSSCAARVAGTVPKIIPTPDATRIAIIADSPETGIRYSVKKRTENGTDSPISVPSKPPVKEINTASVRNWSRIS